MYSLFLGVFKDFSVHGFNMVPCFLSLRVFKDFVCLPIAGIGFVGYIATMVLFPYP